jgi:hypothetical protein
MDTDATRILHESSATSMFRLRVAGVGECANLFNPQPEAQERSGKGTSFACASGYGLNDLLAM